MLLGIEIFKFFVSDHIKCITFLASELEHFENDIHFC